MTEPPTPPLQASQYGLASVILGAVVFLAAPITLVLITQIFANGRGSTTDAEIRAWLARVGVAGPFLIALLGAWLGVRGLQRHRAEGSSYALPVAGLVLSAVALLEWCVTAFAVLWTVESMLR